MAETDTTQQNTFNAENVQTFPIDGGYDHYFMDSEAYITVTKIKENGRGIHGELNIERPPQTVLKSNIIINLSDHQDRYKLAIELAKTYETYLPWDDIIDYACSESIKRYRQGQPVIELWTNQDAAAPEYIAKPLIAKGACNILFSEQASGKTLISTFLMILCLFGSEISTYGLEVARVKNVMLLDYENNYNSTLWNLKCLQLGMELPDIGIYYRQCYLPLATEAEAIKKDIVDNDVGLLIIDSLGLAAGGELKDAREAIIFHAGLRSLDITSLILAHTSKGVDRSKTVFGSIFFENLARNIWEIQKVETDNNQIRVALHHRKPFFSHIFPAVGFEFTFDLDRYYVKQCDPADEPTFREKMSMAVRVEKELENSEYTTRELADILGENLNSVDHAVKRLEKKGKVKKIDNRWTSSGQ